MAKHRKTPMMGLAKYNKTVIGIPEGQNLEDAFDSEFERSIDSAKNCVLRITLRLFFKQINPGQLTGQAMRAIAVAQGIPVPAGVDVGAHKDANNKARLIKEWTGQEWASFVQGAHTQARLWDSQFWLIPPDDFSHSDITEGSWVAKSGSTTTRPNFKCEFRLQIVPNAAMAHKTIEVVNVIDPRGFRSHDSLYKQSDINLKSHRQPNSANIPVNTNQPTIAHEVGHALGLPHIGVLRNLPPCRLATVLNKWPKDFVPALYQGNTNAAVCYGTRSSAGDLDDIMGAGDKFGIENAKPWLNRLPHHYNLGYGEWAQLLMGLPRWKVSKGDHPPMGIVRIR